MRDTNISIPNLRECVSAFVDMYCDEIIHRSATAKDAGALLEGTLGVITSIKTTRWSVMEEIDDVFKWYDEQVKANGNVFAEFIERGYAFLMIHYINEYSPDRIIELRTSAAVALKSVFVAKDSIEIKRPTEKHLKHEAWCQILETYPWMLFVAILRNTYINMGEDPEDRPNGGANER